jgi:hypothetical protein
MELVQEMGNVFNADSGINLIQQTNCAIAIVILLPVAPEQPALTFYAKIAASVWQIVIIVQRQTELILFARIAPMGIINLQETALAVQMLLNCLALKILRCA